MWFCANILTDEVLFLFPFSLLPYLLSNMYGTPTRGARNPEPFNCGSPLFMIEYGINTAPGVNFY
jgi:hypothetical protein